MKSLYYYIRPCGVYSLASEQHGAAQHEGNVVTNHVCRVTNSVEKFIEPYSALHQASNYLDSLKTQKKTTSRPSAPSYNAIGGTRASAAPLVTCSPLAVPI